MRRGFEAYNRGDVDGMMADWAPGAVVDWSNSRGLDARVFRGHNAVRVFMRRLLGSFEKARMELADDPEEIEDRLVIAENVAYLEGRDGIEVQARSTFLIRIRDGEQTSLTLYQTKREALEAAGLQE